MKSIEFGEDQLQDLNEIGKKLFGDENDPRSYLYGRTLVRPKINWLRICAFTFLPVIFLLLLGWFLMRIQVTPLLSVLIALTLLLVYIVIMAKRACICMVKIYQKYAPASIRNKCRFEPSCSEYMILSIEKYGLLKGAFKGVDRLKRCNINNGGIDMP